MAPPVVTAVSAALVVRPPPAQQVMAGSAVTPESVEAAGPGPTVTTPVAAIRLRLVATVAMAQQAVPAVRAELAVMPVLVV
jgi:hypothetical protein